MEEICASIRGIYRDVLKGPKGDLLYDSGWVHNTIVNRCRILLAGLMSNDSANGIQSLIVGYGETGWDSGGIPGIPATATDLVHRFPDAPIGGLGFEYLDGGGQVVGGPTRRLQITATLEPGYPVPRTGGLSTADLREFGLFGSFNGTEYMINNVRHAVIHKDTSATLIRVIRLYF